MCFRAVATHENPLHRELDRNYSVLKQKSDPPPYFMAYSVTDTETNTILASGGAIIGQSQRRNRLLDITTRVGTPKFDNFRRITGQIPRFTVTTAIALDDNDASIREAAWLATDRVYRNSAQRLIQIKADEKLRAAVHKLILMISRRKIHKFSMRPLLP